MKTLFKEKMLGYDKQEVDMYIENLRNEYVKVTENLKILSEKLAEYEAEQSELQEVLLTARATAKAILSEAEEKAERIDVKCRARSQRIVSDAKEEAEKTIFSSQEEANEIISISKAEAENIISAAKTEADVIILSGHDEAKKIIAEAQLNSIEVNIPYPEFERQRYEEEIRIIHFNPATTI